MSKLPFIIFASAMALLMTTGAILKIQHIPAGSIMMTIAMLAIISGLIFLLVKERRNKNVL